MGKFKNKKMKKKKEDTKPIEETEEEEKGKGEGGVLSDSVLEAFDNDATPVVDPLEDDPLLPLEDDEEDMLDSGDYKVSDEW
jgi:hypothetical protein